jgi:type III pantothenate kinase
MYLGIDIGNTQTKFYLLDPHSKTVRNTGIKKIPWKNISFSIISRTGNSDTNITEKLKNYNIPFLEVSTALRLPFRNTYRSKTLGPDRICLVAGASALYEGDLLIIDTGTCITYDFLDKNKIYRGGSISPGLQMRLKAMHAYTAGLPLADLPGKLPPLIARNTLDALQSGAVYGILKEIEGIVNEYQRQYPGLKTVLTGGDALFLSESLKIKIFAIQKNLSAYGMLEILKLNKPE